MRRRIFVYGANTEGRHGKGAALTAWRMHGAQIGLTGLIGNSYGVITKELRLEYPYIDLEFIREEVDKLITCAKDNPDCDFYCTPFGTGLAGFTHTQMKRLFAGKEIPNNLLLPKEWKDTE